MLPVFREAKDLEVHLDHRVHLEKEGHQVQLGQLVLVGLEDSLVRKVKLDNRETKAYKDLKDNKVQLGHLEKEDKMV